MTSKKHLSITVRSIVKIRAGEEGPEWTETVGSWRAAWAIVDDVCDDDRNRADAWSVTADNKLSGKWFLDIR